MSIWDFFRPKWKSSDYQTRMDAVKELDDEEILIEIALSDADESVRKEAVKRIEDQPTLEAVATQDEDYLVRIQALRGCGSETAQLKRILG